MSDLRIQQTKMRALCSVILVVGSLATTAIGAGPVSEYYLTYAKVFVVQGDEVLKSWSVPAGNNQPIAVDSTVRLTSSYPDGIGTEFRLDGNFIGFLPENEISSGDMWDGTSDGAHNYSVNRITGEVMRFDLDWTNPQVLFNVSAGDYLGITYDSDTNTLWLSGYGVDIVENYDMAGKLLSGFEVPTPEAGFIPLTALALDHADGTLWFGRQEFIGRFYQYSKSGRFLGQQIYPELASENILGGEFALPTPANLDGRLDIKPGSCPNPLNRNSHGMMPAAILGTDEIDASQIDVSSVLLSRADGVGGSVAPNEGPPGPHSVFEDVATPFEGELCDCHELEGDGILDLSMKFRTDDVVAALLLNDLPAGDLVELVVTGALLDGTEFSASDCIRLVPPGTPPGLLAVESNLSGVWIDVAPLDLQLDRGGFASFERTYPLGSVVTLVAPQTYLGWTFAGWKVGSLLEPRTTFGLQSSQSIDIVIFADQDTIQAVFSAPSSSVD